MEFQEVLEDREPEEQKVHQDQLEPLVQMDPEDYEDYPE